MIVGVDGALLLGVAEARVDDVALVCVSVVVVANRHDCVSVVAEEHRW